MGYVEKSEAGKTLEKHPPRMRAQSNGNTGRQGDKNYKMMKPLNKNWYPMVTMNPSDEPASRQSHLKSGRQKCLRRREAPPISGTIKRKLKRKM